MSRASSGSNGRGKGSSFDVEDAIRVIGLDEPGRVAKRKEFLEFGGADADRLRALRGFFEEHSSTIIDQLYELWLEFDDTRRTLMGGDPELVRRLKKRQTN